MAMDTLGARWQEANSLSSAYHVFHIQEIASIVCEHLFPDKVALYHLAQTCKNLCDPALRSLWRELRDLSVLIKTMPSDLWEEKALYHSQQLV